MPVEITYKHAKVGLRGGNPYFQIYRYRDTEDVVLFTELIKQVRKLGLSVDLRRMRNMLRDAEEGALIPVPLK